MEAFKQLFCLPAAKKDDEILPTVNQSGFDDCTAKYELSARDGSGLLCTYIDKSEGFAGVRCRFKNNEKTVAIMIYRVAERRELFIQTKKCELGFLTDECMIWIQTDYRFLETSGVWFIRQTPKQTFECFLTKVANYFEDEGDSVCRCLRILQAKASFLQLTPTPTSNTSKDELPDKQK